MSAINFITSNPEKIQIAKVVCGQYKQFNYQIKSINLDIDEIQGEDPVLIVKDKAFKAYQKLNIPLVVSDDSWDIRALNGFPGPYMKSINHWFKAEDLLRLMHGIEDRKVYIYQYLAYYDGKIMKVFKNTFDGQITQAKRGRNSRSPIMEVIELDLDNGKTLAEIFDEDPEVIIKRYLENNDVWHKFIAWFNKLQNS